MIYPQAFYTVVVIYMAALYTVGEGTPYYCILTAAANAAMRLVQHRTPLVLQRRHAAV